MFVFLSFLALSGVFWLIMTLNQNYEQEVKVLVRYVNVPRNAVLTSTEVDTLCVTIRDKGFVLLSYLYGGQSVAIDVDFMKYGKTMGSGLVSGNDLKAMVEAKMPASSSVVSLKPDQLPFYYNFGERKVVPVEWRGQVLPEQLYFISGMRCTPDSVTVYASKSMLDSISVVYTEDLNYSEFHDTLQVSAALVKMPGVKMVPDRVDLQFYTDVLTEESINGIPVVAINLPEGKIIRTFPAKVGVTFVTGMKTYQALSAKDFVAVVDYEELIKSSSSQCAVRLTQFPQNISRVSLQTEVVDCLIEEKAP